MTSKDYRLALWKEYLKKVDFISEREKENLDAIAKMYFEDQSFLLEVYKAFAKDLDYLEDQENHVHYEKDGKDYILALENIETVFDREHFAKVIAAMLDLLEEMLPLGTVVDLDPETMKLAGEKVNEEKAKAGEELIDVDAVENFRMVITHRFLGSDGKYYYPYAGVAYPMGMLGSSEVFYFTRAFVKQHGILLTEVSENTPLKVYPPVSFYVAIKGASELNFKITEINTINLRGISKDFTGTAANRFEQEHIM